MKKIVYVILMILLLSGCNKDVATDDSIKGENTEQEEKIVVDDEKNDIDRTEYLTGEIITDGFYTIHEEIGYSTLSFVPDKESSEIIVDKYVERENYSLAYDSLEKVRDLPDELGIYKVKVKIDRVDDYSYYFIDSIELTDEIGTILYEGKEFETNDLDDTVNVKDRVCGLIVKYVNKTDTGGIIIRFAGEIESEGYYQIDPLENDIFGPNGRIFVEKEYKKNFPTIYGEANTFSIWFSKTNELFDELANHSLFGRGKFKTRGYYLVYNHGMGAGPGEVISEIISLEEGYAGMFKVEENQYIEYECWDEDFVVVAVTKYVDSLEDGTTDYYYINRKAPEKIYLFTSDRYDYIVKSKVNEHEFTLSTTGFNMSTGNTEAGHDMICKITEQGASIDKKIAEADDIYINLFELNDGEFVRLAGNKDDFVIVSVDKTDENNVITFSEYYYINKNDLKNIFLFSTDEYDYQMGVVTDKNQFLITSKRLIETNANEPDIPHSLICSVSDSGAIVEKVEGSNISNNMRDSNYSSFVVRGIIDGIRLNDTAVVIDLKDIKMRERDIAIYGDMGRDGSVEILLLDNDTDGHEINVGDSVSLLCHYTNDNKILYASTLDKK
ncbi:membrane lipoprotein lipid attachment site-containing protein [Sedimentibacter sp.]|uniref:membrane lipoprotein lipid attachment site-containing protein n=1 Tax=Sedimentibacter sp. TaxID=1960295 RepID=UPI00289DDE8A|nr:membrane lipoprotein lipid attachment site-containing protein [Sedimentibacter sp.]